MIAKSSVLLAVSDAFHSAAAEILMFSTPKYG
jgi:hypothetical protein